MNPPSTPYRKIVETILPWLSLAALFTYSYVKFFQHPYGFGWDPNGEIYIVFRRPAPPTLQVGDQLVQIGPLTWDAFHADLRKTFFEGVKPGETVPIVIQRDHETLTLQWTLPGMNPGEVKEQFFSEWFLAYVFWFAGALTLLFLGPRDERRTMLAAFNFLTAVWLESGGGASNYHLWYSAIILRMAVWLSLPVYLHLHWVFPRPLGKFPPTLTIAVYTGAGLLMIAQAFQVLPQDLYFLGFLLAVLGSLILLIAHTRRQADSRQELRIVWIAILFALLPVLAVAVIGLINGSSRAESLALVSFPALPLSYLYAAYRRQLGGLEVRVNRLVSIYLFLILLITISMPIIAGVDRILNLTDEPFIVALVAALTASIVSILGFPIFESFVERRWLGISLPTQQLPQIYSRQATASTSIIALLDLLKRDILPSLLIREFLFLRLDGASTEVLLTVGLSEEQILAVKSLPEPLAADKAFSSPALPENGQVPAWVRIKLPLRVGGHILGIWFFGRRDPDDHYPQAEVLILQSLADQTAITLSNIIHTERLRTVYQTDINRYEQERQRLALELHDGILNRMAELLMKLDDKSLTPAFLDSYNELIKHLREIVSDLRPALLNFGLKPAIEDLAEDLKGRSKNSIRISVKLETDESRYALNVEQHLYRIVQEACINSLHHAKPTEIIITGRLNARAVEFNVMDNGIGFDHHGKLDSDILLASRHFGLVGMFERAELIGAEIKIDPQPEAGTRVQVTWKPGEG